MGFSAVVCYMNLLLPMLGVELPVSETVSFFGFYGLYLAAGFAVSFFLRNRAQVCYALAYDALCLPPEDRCS